MVDTRIINGMTYLMGGDNAVGRSIYHVSKERVRDFSPKQEANIGELCRRFGISPTTGYKWLGRFRGDGKSG
jgi:hypothetical protein